MKLALSSIGVVSALAISRLKFPVLAGSLALNASNDGQSLRPVKPPQSRTFLVTMTRQILPRSILLLCGIALLEGGSARAATLIDDFTQVEGVEQSVIRGGSATQIAIREQSTTATGFTQVIGGYRDLWLQAVAGTTTNSTRTAVGAVSDGVLSFANGPGVQSWLNVTWDGNDTGTVGTNTSPGPGNNAANPSNLGTPSVPGTFGDTANDLRKINRSGLGDQDLTNGGLFNSIGVEVLSADLGLQLDVYVYDTNTTGVSLASYTFNQGVTQKTPLYFTFNQAASNILNPYGIRNVVFSKLSTAPSAARFDHVGAINLILKATRTDVDATVNLIRPTNTAEAIPEPSISWLALSAIGATAFFGVKKRNY